MNSPFLLILESSSLILLSGLLALSYFLRHAPLGFQHFNLFYYGTPPETFVPVESADSLAFRPSDWQ